MPYQRQSQTDALLPIQEYYKRRLGYTADIETIGMLNSSNPISSSDLRSTIVTQIICIQRSSFEQSPLNNLYPNTPRSPISVPMCLVQTTNASNEIPNTKTPIEGEHVQLEFPKIQQCAICAQASPRTSETREVPRGFHRGNIVLTRVPENERPPLRFSATPRSKRAMGKNLLAVRCAARGGPARGFWPPPSGIVFDAKYPRVSI